MTMETFRKEFTFTDGVSDEFRPGHRLANWPDGTWEIEDGLLRERRSRLEELDIRLKYARANYGADTSWIKIRRAPYPALVVGDKSWGDCVAETRLRVESGGRAGLAMRWEDARHCYYVFLEEGKWLSFYTRYQDEVGGMRVEFEHSAEAFYTLRVEAKGNTYTCSVDGVRKLMAVMEEGDPYPRGGVALLTETAATYEYLTIEGECEPVVAPELPAEIVPTLEQSVSIAPIAPSEYRPSLMRMDGEPTVVMRTTDGAGVRFIGADGSEKLCLGPWDGMIGLEGGQIPLQVFDLNSDGKDEVILVAEDQLRVYDGQTGDLLASQDIPEPNAYGECLNDPEWATLNDAICPVRLGEGKMGFYLKDRYWNIHLYDANLDSLWHRPVNTGHYPLPVDVDGDGRDEIMCCHTLFDADGNVRWSATLHDHADSHMLESLDGKDPVFTLMSGEEGVVQLDPKTGEVLRQYKLGHAQSCVIGEFVPGMPGKQLLLETLWCESWIQYLIDGELNEIARWEHVFTVEGVQPYALPWGDRDLMVVGDGVYDPMTGVRFAEPGPWASDEKLLGQWVVDWPGAGASRIVQLRADRIDVFAPAADCVRRSTTLNHYNSGYLPR
jgi:rhamnogalacturonan endolyase